MFEYNNELSAEEYCALREAVEWPTIATEQAQAGLEHSDFIIACRCNNVIVGSGITTNEVLKGIGLK